MIINKEILRFCFAFWLFFLLSIFNIHAVKAETLTCHYVDIKTGAEVSTLVSGTNECSNLCTSSQDLSGGMSGSDDYSTEAKGKSGSCYVSDLTWQGATCVATDSTGVKKYASVDAKDVTPDATGRAKMTPEEFCKKWASDNNYTFNPTEGIQYTRPAADIARTAEMNANLAGDTVCSTSNLLACFLIPLLFIVKYILILAVSTISWICDPIWTRNLLDSPEIYTNWSIVRDLINIVFVLLLLFSAFATIFQIEKYNYKKILAKLIIAAFLVNFSFPITRIIIDASNVVMYSLFGSLFGDTTSGAMSIIENSNLKSILNDSSYPNNTSLFFGIVCVFLVGISLLAFGVLLVVRLIAFVVLIVLSPAAFVASAVPSAGGLSNKWWKFLINYSFFGPIMAFMFYLAISFMSALNVSGFDSLASRARNNMQANGQMTSSSLASILLCLVPVIIIWFGMGIAHSFGIAGADATMGRAKKFAKWVPNAGFRATGVPGTYKKFAEDFKKTGKLFGKKIPLLGTEPREEREARWAAGLSGGLTAAQRVKFEQDRKRVKEASEKQEMETMNTTQLRDLATNSRNNFERAAAIQALAKRGQANINDLQFLLNSFGGERSQVFRQAQSDLKVFDPATAFAHITDANAKREAIEGHIRSAQFDPKKLNLTALQNSEFMEIALQNQKISSKELEDIRNKSDQHQSAITATLDTIATNATLDRTIIEAEIRRINPAITPANLRMEVDNRLKINRNIHLTHLSQTGTIHSSIDNPNDAYQSNQRRQLFAGLNKENAKRIKEGVIADFADEIADSINAGQYKEIIQHMQSNTARRNLNEHIALNTFRSGTNAASIQKIIHNDSYLNNL